MGRIGMATRDELVGALTVRYTASNRRERGRILDEYRCSERLASEVRDTSASCRSGQSAVRPTAGAALIQ